MQESRFGKVKGVIVGIGIFLIYMFALGYGFQAFYPGPQWQDYCAQLNKPIPYIDGTNCARTAEMNQLENQCYADGGQPAYDVDAKGCQVFKECDFCNKEFEKVHNSHTNVVFVIALIIGLITIGIGFAVLSVEPVGSALIASGIGALVYGTIQNWQNFTAVWRFVLLFIVLVLLVLLGLHMSKKK